MYKFLVVSFLLAFCTANSQELNCTVAVNYDKITNANVQIFKSLERALNEFVNNNKWSEVTYKSNEKINCSMFIIINSYEGNTFETSIQVQSSRTIFNSSYSSPVVNVNDKDFVFNYVEFENLSYNPNSFDSNLMSVLAFYCNYIIGMDAETFEPNGGDPHFEIAQDIIALAAPTQIKGWGQSESNRQNRFFLINDLLSPTFKAFRQAMYSYHFDGLDTMEKDTKKAKEIIKASLATLNEVHSTRPNAYMTRTFFDAKADEIVSIFSGGPTVPSADLVEMLNRMSPTNSSKWTNIR
jgi:hypothetical protein